LDGPADPFLPDDPGLCGDPLAEYLFEAAALAGAFANVGSLASLAEMLCRAPDRDVEMAALFVFVMQAREQIDAAVGRGDLTREEAHARWEKWLSDPIDLVGVSDA
jgi:hypothetical protein